MEKQLFSTSKLCNALLSKATIAMTIALITSCGQQTQPNVDSNRDNIQTKAVVINRLVSLDEIDRAVNGNSVEILGAQYYLAGGTGGLNFLSKPLSLENFKSIFWDEIERRPRNLAVNMLTSLDKDQVFNSQLTAEQVNYISQTDARINNIENVSVQSPMVYALYVRGSIEDIRNIANNLKVSQVDNVDQNRLNSYNLSYVSEAYNNFYNSVHMTSLAKEDANEVIKRYMNIYNVDNNLSSQPIQNLDSASTLPIWWPAGYMLYAPRTSYWGGHVADVNFVFAWGTTRLNNFQNIRKGVYNLDAFEIDFITYDSSTLIYSACSAYTSLPYGYDDCVTSGFADYSGLLSFGFGSFDNNYISPNFNYDANITLYGSGTYPYTGWPMTTSVTAQALHCYTLSVWSCGVYSYLEKESRIIVPKNTMSIRFNQNYSQGWQ